MALKLKQAGAQPIGQFDGYDQDYLTIKGGEIGRFMSVTWTYPGSTDLASADIFDGYSGVATKVRPAISHTLTSTSGTYRPLFLLDEGTNSYGVMFGYVVGGINGQIVPNPGSVSGTTNLGPHTATGSGKVTCWDKPGLYGVTLDAVASSINPSSSTPTPGNPLYANTSGQLTLTSSESFDYASGTSTIVGRFVEFDTNGSLVTTPSYLAKKNVVRAFTEMLFTFRIEN